MESRVESYALRSTSVPAKPNMFKAGISNKFTKRHVINFHDTTLTAASAAKARAELKMERQASAIEKQQQKIEQEMKKIEAITEKLQRQQAREAKRLRNRLVYAASRIQIAYRAHLACVRGKHNTAVVEVQRHWRGYRGRQLARMLAAEKRFALEDNAARVITRNVRIYTSRLVLHHEIEWRRYAVTVIQSAVRRRQAMRELSSLRRAREDSLRACRAATVIQAHARGFLTRLVYMDVLFLVCRIQSVARGFLVRKRLRWLLSLNLRAIVELQALVRGFLVRQRMKPLLQSRRVQVPQVGSQEEIPRSSRNRRASKPRMKVAQGYSSSDAPSQRLRSVRQAHKSPSREATFALATMASMAPSAPSPLIIKRSYWLPSGANSAMQSRPTHQRLPQLPVKRPLPLGSSSSPLRAVNEVQSFDHVAAHVVNMQRMVRGKLLAKKRPPLRLEPLECATSNGNRRPHQLVDFPDDSTETKTADERREREEILKRKLMARRAQEKKHLEQEHALRQQLVKEESERKQMEREEKLMRLWLKTSRRKHLELKMRRVTLDQQREEKERMEMLREERLARLHMKWTSRLSNGLGAPRRGSRQDLSLESSDSDPESDDNPTLTKKGREDEEYITKPQKPITHTQHAKSVMRSIPVATKPAKTRNKPSDIAKKKTRELRAVYGGPTASNQTSTHDEERSYSRDLQAQYASWNFHSDDDFAMRADLVEDEAEFDYGNEFEEVVEEANLTRLLC